jgi:putative ABC transport system permease protein
MDSSVNIIPLSNLALAFIPVGIVILIMLRWSLNATDGLVAIGRMLLQLLLIGYLLNWIFAAESALIVLAILSVMLCVASWIALRPLNEPGWKEFSRALAAILIAGCLTLFLVTGLVLETDPWYAPRQVIPLGGMIFASAMNAVSITAERLGSELERGTEHTIARRLAFQAGLIPLLNSLLAVGLVSLPGMMTGQILSGIEPLIAARYQIVVMCMITGAAGMAAAIYLQLILRDAQS